MGFSTGIGLLGSSYISLTRIVPDWCGGWRVHDSIQVKECPLHRGVGKAGALLVFFVGCVCGAWCFHGLISTPLHTILTEISSKNNCITEGKMGL